MLITSQIGPVLGATENLKNTIYSMLSSESLIKCHEQLPSSSS